MKKNLTKKKLTGRGKPPFLSDASSSARKKAISLSFGNIKKRILYSVKGPKSPTFIQAHSRLISLLVFNIMCTQVMVKTNSISFANTHLCTLVKRGTVRQHNVGARTATVRDMAGQCGNYNLQNTSDLKAQFTSFCSVLPTWLIARFNPWKEWSIV